MEKCGYCGAFHAGVCSRVKAIEYHENGMVKRVEFHAAFQTVNPPDTHGALWRLPEVPTRASGGTGLI